VAACPLLSSHSTVLFTGASWRMSMFMVILSLLLLYLLTFDVDMGQHSACLCMF
jgi:hypothetical protein